MFLPGAIASKNRCASLRVNLRVSITPKQRPGRKRASSVPLSDAKLVVRMIFLFVDAEMNESELESSFVITSLPSARA